ncbi:hypothetical protein CTEN210_09143 [Chaetoceros tenuissimus]|uniref:Ankyrin repeat-containing domain n=1 Tax=Chaetoceros tenuissimus TaxID=426638 RepID=A0AAD3H6Q8_9STRA|nr:hypothetical protein CTEN210_09143 [Chaetoceros tenuissimus]
MSSAKRIKVTHDERGGDASSASDDNKHIQDFPNNVFQHCLEFVGKGNFAFVAPVSKHFYWNYINLGVEMKNNVIDVDVILQQGRNKKTTVKDVATGSLRLATECFLKAPKEFHIEVCRQAAVNGRLNILKCASALGIDMKESVFPCHFLVETIANDHLDVIEFLHDQGVDLDNKSIIADINTFKKGKARNLHWMVSKGIISSCVEKVFNCLVREGEIDILKESYEPSSNHFNKSTFLACAEGGNIEVMNWLMEQHDCDWKNRDIFSRAAISGSIPIMEMCLQNGCPADQYTYLEAMKNKEASVTALKWFRNHDIPWDEQVCNWAAANGNLKALKWARENGCPWETETFKDAATSGNIEILDYCWKHNCPVDHNWVYDYLVDFDNSTISFKENQDRSLNVRKWLHHHVGPGDKDASLNAAECGYLTTLIWAIDNGCPWHEDILGCAIGQFDFPMVEYSLKHHSPMDNTVYALAMDKMNDNREIKMDADSDLKMIKMLQMFHDYGIPWSRDIIPQAERVGRSKVANWLRCVGCPE